MFSQEGFFPDDDRPKDAEISSRRNENSSQPTIPGTKLRRQGFFPRRVFPKNDRPKVQRSSQDWTRIVANQPAASEISRRPVESKTASQQRPTKGVEISSKNGRERQPPGETAKRVKSETRRPHPAGERRSRGNNIYTIIVIVS